MDQTVKHAPVTVKTPDYGVEKSPVLVFVTTPQGEGDQIGKLDQTRGFRIYEQWDFGHMSQLAPAGAIHPEFLSQRLQRLFIM